MYFVLFIGSVPTDRAELSGKYYNTLQPLLQNIEGFLEETSFAAPSQPGVRCLFARFANGTSLVEWRNHPTHLRIMHHARREVFDQFRITVGTDALPSATAASDEQRVVIAYQRPATQEAVQEDMNPSYLFRGTASDMLAECQSYASANIRMWVLRLKFGASADEFEASFERIPGDALYRIYVLRDYTKDDRTEAPEGITKAEAAAGAED